MVYIKSKGGSLGRASGCLGMVRQERGSSSILSHRPTWFPPAARGLEPLGNAEVTLRASVGLAE